MTNRDFEAKTKQMTDETARTGDDVIASLEKDAPTLKAWSAQRLNKRGVAFFLGMLLLAAFFAAWAFKSLIKPAAETDKALRDEVVQAPELILRSPADVATVEVAQPIVVEKTEDKTVDPKPKEPIQVAPVAPIPLPVVPPERIPTPQEILAGQRKQSGLLTENGNAALMNAPRSQEGFFNKEFADVKQGAVQRLNNRDMLLSKGSYVRCVLETKIVSDLKGNTSCVVSEPVYSNNGRQLLFARGSKIIGEYQNADINQGRIEVIWRRVTTPNGWDVRIDSQGVGSDGTAGHAGRYDSHWASRFAGAVMVSLVSDAFKVAGQLYGPKTTVDSINAITENPYDSNTASTLQRSAEQALNRTINQPPTVTIPQGSLISIYVTRDIDFSTVIN